jgi:hypothetical protein
VLSGRRWGLILAWAGILTLAILSVMAAVQLAFDVLEVLRVWGGRVGLLARLGPTALLGLATLALLVLVVRVAGSGRRGATAAVVIGFVVLVGVRVVVAGLYDGVGDGEPRQYDRLARAVLAGECCVADLPMGFPILLAAAYRLVADPQVAVEGVNVLFATLAGAAVLGLGARLYGVRVGSAALLAYAVWPAGALMVGVRLPHIAYDMAVAVAAWVTVSTPPGWRGSAVLGAVLGLSQYLRPSTPALLPAFLLARAWPGGRWSHLVGGVVAPISLAFLLMLLPVAWHNLGAYGELSVSTSSYAGHSLYIGTDERSGGRFSRQANEELMAIAGPDPRARSEAGMRLALERIRRDPLAIAVLAVRKQSTLWATERYGVEYGIDRRLRQRPAEPRATTPLLMSQAFLAAVLVTATAGLWLRRRESDALAVLAIFLVWSVALAHALLEVRDRHHSYVIPVLLPLAALGAVAIIDGVAAGLERRRRGPPLNEGS